MGHTGRPAVSVLVPVYNAQRYLDQCMRALCGQVLEDIEIIALNDGSTDSSSEILHGYADRCARVRVIDKSNSGYGATLNRGLDEARGEYVGIVEPDDFPDLVMFQKLYKTARRFDCDLVKCNYFERVGNRDSMVGNFRGFTYGAPFDPRDMPSIICTIPSIWAALYRREMLERDGIRFRETPGAAFQDTSFTLKSWFSATRCALVRRPMLHYRMDNPQSSSKTTDRLYVVCDELESAERFLREKGDRAEAFLPWFYVDKWGKYCWNYARIDASLHEEFAARMMDEYARARDAGELDLAIFEPRSREQIEFLLAEGPRAFAERFPETYECSWKRPS